MRIQVLGTGCAKCKQLTASAEKAVAELGLGSGVPDKDASEAAGLTDRRCVKACKGRRGQALGGPATTYGRSPRP